ncbi:MAG: Periplasmic binding protein [Methanothrix harundinacea]|uniref:Periplasmic binding protein n=1 Tax=Methanothrix harundinacea TaxID=301375 RepID=A0A101FU76_9EURY|nr:MAG: Periplasmic binding protein [Methanothrix harundinacea]
MCLSLVVMPAVADGDSFSEAYKDTLTVYGNANLDDIIDEDDVEYVQGIIDGTEEETQFADADYDGQIDESDIAQIELIIAGEEDYLVILDMDNRTVTVVLQIIFGLSICSGLQEPPREMMNEQRI